jgi:hypothetical protein
LPLFRLAQLERLLRKINIILFLSKEKKTIDTANEDYAKKYRGGHIYKLNKGQRAEQRRSFPKGNILNVTIHHCIIIGRLLEVYGRAGCATSHRTRWMDQERIGTAQKGQVAHEILD